MSDDDDNKLFSWWGLFTFIQYAIIVSLVAITHALFVRWILMPFPVFADYVSKGIVISWIIVGAWYGERVVNGFLRWEDSRRTQDDG